MPLTCVPLLLAVLICLSISPGEDPPTSELEIRALTHDRETLLDSPPEWESFEQMNTFYVDAFVSGRNFGFSRLMDADFPQFKTLEVSGQRYNTRKLELVGLLMAPAPRVYETFGNPTKREVRRAQVRQLDDFEHDALAMLATGEDVVVDRGEGTARAFGAIRASAQCLRCHGGSEGQLLGAFSYRLIPNRRAAGPGNEAPSRSKN